MAQQQAIFNTSGDATRASPHPSPTPLGNNSRANPEPAPRPPATNNSLDIQEGDEQQFDMLMADADLPTDARQSKATLRWSLYTLRRISEMREAAITHAPAYAHLFDLKAESVPFIRFEQANENYQAIEAVATKVLDLESNLMSILNALGQKMTTLSDNQTRLAADESARHKAIKDLLEANPHNPTNDAALAGQLKGIASDLRRLDAKVNGISPVAGAKRKADEADTPNLPPGAKVPRINGPVPTEPSSEDPANAPAVQAPPLKLEPPTIPYLFHILREPGKSFWNTFYAEEVRMEFRAIVKINKDTGVKDSDFSQVLGIKATKNNDLQIMYAPRTHIAFINFINSIIVRRINKPLAANKPPPYLVGQPLRQVPLSRVVLRGLQPRIPANGGFTLRNPTMLLKDIVKSPAFADIKDILSEQSAPRYMCPNPLTKVNPGVVISFEDDSKGVKLEAILNKTEVYVGIYACTISPYVEKKTLVECIACFSFFHSIGRCTTGPRCVYCGSLTHASHEHTMSCTCTHCKMEDPTPSHCSMQKCARCEKKGHGLLSDSCPDRVRAIKRIDKANSPQVESNGFKLAGKRPNTQPKTNPPGTRSSGKGKGKAEPVKHVNPYEALAQAEFDNFALSEDEDEAPSDMDHTPDFPAAKTPTQSGFSASQMPATGVAGPSAP
jgi:hypothetical protein